MSDGKGRPKGGGYDRGVHKKKGLDRGGVGFNENSGIVYIALENGVTICSMMGNDVEYLVTNFDTGNEYFFDTYEEALTFEVDLAN